MKADPGERQRLARLRQFIVLDVAISALATSFTLAVYLFVERNAWLLLSAALAGTGALTMAAGLRPLARGAATKALWFLVVGNWGVALTTAFVATFAWPVQVIAAVLPIVVAVPYVTPLQLRLMILGAVGVATATASLGLLQDYSGLSDEVPQWSRDAVLILFTPGMAVLITQAGARTAETLRESLQLSLEANIGLTESEALLASQAEMLRSSRSRIVAAADSERRRIERDLHDGAQQRLVGLSLQLSLAREQVVSDPAAAQHTLDRIREEVRHAQDDMRNLVRGLYPPVLTQHGLASAIRSVVGQIDNPLHSEIDDVGRFDPEIESALYFVCLEAVQNISKHAGADALVTVNLSAFEAEVRLEVIDDGAGFDPGEAGTGSGLANMADRMGAAGGRVRVVAAPGEGSRVTAVVPVR